VFAYDGDNLVEETNSSGTAVARYSDGLNIDEPLAMLRSGATNFYHADGLGSITSLSNTSGSIAQTYTFDSFGNQTGSSGSLTNPFRYTAREFDPETSLYYYRARYYDPTIGRFLSEDRLRFRGGIDFYVYVENNAVNLKDPYGRSSAGRNKEGLSCGEQRDRCLERSEAPYSMQAADADHSRCMIVCNIEVGGIEGVNDYLQKGKSSLTCHALCGSQRLAQRTACKLGGESCMTNYLLCKMGLEDNF